VALLALALLSLPSRTTDRLKLAIGSFFVPLFGLAGATQQASSAAVDALTPRRELLRLNDTLTRENQRLKLEAAQTAQINQENARLRELIGWQRQTQWKLKLANVILRDPASWWRTIQIDLGSQDGLRENLAVRTTEGLVGRISSVGTMRSQVVLLGDPNCKVAAMVENPTGDKGVVGTAAGPFDGSFVVMNYLSRSANVKPGQRVVSSGEGEFSQRHPHRQHRGDAPGGIRPSASSSSKTRRQSRRAGGSVGDDSMSLLHHMLILAATVLAVFCQAAIARRVSLVRRASQSAPCPDGLCRIAIRRRDTDARRVARRTLL